MSLHVIALKNDKLFKRSYTKSHYSIHARGIGNLMHGEGIEVYMVSQQAIVNNPYRLDSAEFANYVREHGLPI